METQNLLPTPIATIDNKRTIEEILNEQGTDKAQATIFCVELLKSDLFADIPQALQIYIGVNDAFFCSKNEVATLNDIICTFKQLALSEQQQRFILEHSLKYFTDCNFKKKYQPKADIAKALLQLYLQNDTAKQIRTKMRNMVAKELNDLPNVLERLDDEKRINIVVKLLPYIQPAVKQTAINWENNDSSIW